MLIRDIPNMRPGPVEALHSIFEEEERKQRQNSEIYKDFHYETYLFALRQMPGKDNATGPGFQDTAGWVLGDRISPKASSLIQDSGWSLLRLLTATDEDLKSIGIAFEQDRRSILSAVRCFHLAPWRTMQTIKLKPETNKKLQKIPIVFLLETFSRLVQQVYADTATVAWLRQRIPKTEEDKERLKKIVVDTLDVTASLIKLSEEIHRQTKKINRRLPKHPIDLIEAKDKKAKPIYREILKFSLLMGSVTILLPQIEAKFYPLTLNSLTKISLKLCLLAIWMLY